LRFEVLTAASMKMTVFWDVAPCSLVEVYRCFRAIVLMMEAVNTSETSVYFNQTTRSNILEESPSLSLLDPVDRAISDLWTIANERTNMFVNLRADPQICVIKNSFLN
jgi:hypothetical protein